MSATALPGLIRPQRVPARAVVVAFLCSLGVAGGGILEGLPLWAIAALSLVPVGTVCAIEGSWKIEHYGMHAVFAGLVLLQLGHMGEHVAQVVQLGVTRNLAASQGIFGQLNTEVVHFVWEVTLYVSVWFLLFKLSPRNRWLWAAAFFLSVHAVEHIYLLYVYLFDKPFYSVGGSNGILSSGGLIGSPLARPYLHFIYNLLVTVPLVMAFFEEARLAYDRLLARALPQLDTASLVVASQASRRLEFDTDEVIAAEGAVADHVFLVTAGAVTVRRRGDLLDEVRGPGSLLDEAEIVDETGHYSGTVVAQRPAEVLSLDRAVVHREEPDTAVPTGAAEKGLA